MLKPVAAVVGRTLGRQKKHNNLVAERTAYAEIGRIVGIPFSTENVYERFAAQVATIIPFDMIIISQLNAEHDSFTIKYTFGMDVTGLGPGKTLPLKGSVVAMVAGGSRAIKTDQYLDGGLVYQSLAEVGLLSRIGTPLIANEQVVGTLHLSSMAPEAYGSEDLARLEIVGNQIAGAIASEILLQSERDRSRQLKSLYDVAAILAEPLSFEAKSQKIVDELAWVTGAAHVILRLVNEEQEELTLVASSAQGSIQFQPSLKITDANLGTLQAYRKGEAILINDFRNFQNAQPRLLEQGVQSMYFLPIWSEGRMLGSLSVASTDSNYFDEARVELITAFSNELGSLFRMAEQAANIQESQRELQTQNLELTRLNQGLENHYEISTIFSEDGAFSGKSKLALEVLVELTSADWVTLRLPKKSTSGLHLVAAAGPEVLLNPPPPVVTESEAVSMAAFFDNKMIVIDDYTACPTASPVLIAIGMRSQVFVPVRSGERTLGLITVISKSKSAFNAEVVGVLALAVERFGVLLENALLHDEAIKSQEDLEVLAEALANSNRQINESNQRLEGRVKTRTKELENARERAMRSEKLAMIGQLSGGIAHDLRNPLGTIKNAAYLTRQKLTGDQVGEAKEKNDAKILELLGLIDGEITRAESVISELLSYGSSTRIVFSEIKVEDVVNDSITGFVLDDNVQLTVDFEPGLPSIRGDSILLIRALQNVLVNAQDAIEDAWPNEGRLSITARSIDGFVELVISDTGSGISNENLEKIFEPLYTAKTYGTGLGLAVCQEIINNHNGSISVKSEIGKGTSFTISVPSVVATEAE